MDLWRWVGETQRSLEERGQRRLAVIMDRVSTATCDGRATEVEAIVAEGIPLARAAREPWVEVFLRHWRLQSRIFHECDVSAGMGEAVELLDFAHTDATRDCPQSICVTQDLAHAYGFLDGPGYVEPRLAACEETLERIDRSWPCWQCIGAERGDALLDARRFEDAEAYARAEIAALESRGISAAVFHSALVDALLALGRADEAKRVIERTRRSGTGAAGEKTFRIRKALVLARVRELEPARASLADPKTLDPDHYVGYARLLRELARLGERELVPVYLRDSVRFVTRLADKSARHISVLVARILGETALELGDSVLARDLLDEASELAKALLAGEREHARIAELASRLLGPGAADEEPDARLERLVSLGLDRRAARTLESFIPRAKEDLGSFRRIFAILKRAGADSLVSSFLDALGDTHPRQVRRARTIHALDRRDASAARAFAGPLLTDGATTDDDRLLVGRVLRTSGAYDEAIALFRTIGFGGERARDVAWELAIAASCALDHASAREAAVALGFHVDEGDGPIDAPCEFIQIERERDLGGVELCAAERISPVTARIVSFGRPRERTPFGDVVVFDPAPIADAGSNAPPNSPRFTFRELRRISSASRRCHLLEGVRARGSSPVATLLARLEALGLAAYDVSDPALAWSASAPPHHDVRVFLLVPEDRDERVLADELASAIRIDGWHVVSESLLESLAAWDELDEAIGRRDAFLDGDS